MTTLGQQMRAARLEDRAAPRPDVLAAVLAATATGVPVTYGSLPGGLHNLGRNLAAVTAWAFLRALPPICAYIVNARTGEPSEGFYRDLEPFGGLPMTDGVVDRPRTLAWARAECAAYFERTED